MSSYVTIDDIHALTEEFKKLGVAKRLHDERIQASAALDKIKEQTTLFDNADNNALLREEKVRLELRAADKKERDDLEKAIQKLKEREELEAEIQKLKEENAGIKPIERPTTSAPVKPQEAHNPVIITVIICIAIVIAIALSN